MKLPGVEARRRARAAMKALALAAYLVLTAGVTADATQWVTNEEFRGELSPGFQVGFVRGVLEAYFEANVVKCPPPGINVDAVLGVMGLFRDNGAGRTVILI